MLQTDYHDGALTAYITGELDHDAAANIRAQLDGAVSALRPCQLTLDFSRVSFMDSSGVGLVLGRYRCMRLLGGRLSVVNIPQSIYKIFAISGLERLGVLG